jgi:hypothetical protein
MQRKRFSNTSHWWRYLPLVAAGLVVTACGQDMTPPEKQQDVPPAFSHLIVGATEYNLIDPNDPTACTTAATCLVEINDGYWQFPFPFQVGTGNLNPFWDTHETGTSECFNTDFDQPGQGLVLNCARSSWTNPLPLNEVPFFFFDPPGADPPVLVREIVIDLNEPNDSPETAQVSIDFFRVYLCEAGPGTPPNPNPALFSTTAQVETCDKVYSIEVGGINTLVEGTGLAWDASTQGSGNSLDYRVLIPETFFEAANQAGVDSCPYDPAGDPCGLYVIVWAHLGGKGGVDWITSGGFEEMSTVLRPVPARKSGVKFHDLDADGVKDAGEPGLAGWTIFVDVDGNGALSAGDPSDVTDATGAYDINAIPEGTWRVREVLQAGWTCSYPTTSDAFGCYHEEEFEDGDVFENNDFGNWQPGTKSGTKFEDENANGVDDGAGDAGLAGWTINAYADTDQNGVLSLAEYNAGTAATDVTDATGAYSLSLNPGGAHAGKYIVCEVAQATWTQSAPGGADECTGGVPTLAPDGWAITITSGSTDTGNDFGNYQNGTKSGTKFEDEDADGTDDGAGEAGLAGWTINAYADTDQNGVLSLAEYNAGTADTDVTDATGAYSLSLAPGGTHAGKYIVCEEKQANWTQSAPSNTICQAGSATLADGGWAITITSGSTDTGNDFGNWQAGTKSGTKFNDVSMDGVFDGTESGLAGWTINAYADTDQDGLLSLAEYNAGPAATDVTDASGDYSLTLNPGGTHAGKYIVCEVAQAGWTQSAPANSICDAGEPPLALGGWAITITSGSTDTDNDFGNFVPVVGTETAYARGHGGATCFTDLGIANNWGWGITVNVDDLPEEYEIWAGAAQCITANGTLVGTLTVSIVGGKIRFTYNLTVGTLEAIHVYVSTTGFPPNVAPGQFPYSSTTENFVDTILTPAAGTTIYFIAHAVVSGL